MTRQPSRGFTLIELLIALSMAAMISLTLYVSMSTAFRARRTASGQITAMRQASITMDLVARDLQSIPRPNGQLAGPFLGTADGGAAGESATVNFYAFSEEFPSNPPATEGMRQIEFALVSEANSHTLVRRVQSNLLAQTLPEPVEEVIASGVRAFGIRYYDGTDWVDSWDSTAQDNQLPLAMELTIELDEPTVRDPAKPYRVTRIIPLPCGVAAGDSTSTTATGATTGGG